MLQLAPRELWVVVGCGGVGSSNDDHEIRVELWMSDVGDIMDDERCQAELLKIFINRITSCRLKDQSDFC